MEIIRFRLGCTLDSAYSELQENAPCTGEFNGKTLTSCDTLDDIYIKVTGKTKQEFIEILRKEVEDFEKEEAEFKNKIPKLIEEYRQRARGIIPNDSLEYWDDIVPIRLKDIYHGMELDCILELVGILNSPEIDKEELFEKCKEVFYQQGHSGGSASLVFSGLARFHPLGLELCKYLK